jgi:hypothetical protein
MAEGIILGGECEVLHERDPRAMTVEQRTVPSRTIWKQ